MSKPVLTIAETAALFGRTEKTIRRAIRAGAFEVIRVGRTTYVLREPLEKLLKGGFRPPEDQAGSEPSM